MFLHSHIGLGWCVAELGQGSARFRRWVLSAAVLPDLDGISILWGQEAFYQYHHLLMHGLSFSLLVSLGAVLHCKKERVKALLCTQLAFYTHYFGDYFLTKFELSYFYPFSRQTFNSPHSVWIGNPINHIAGVVLIIAVIFLSCLFKRTPLESILPSYDKRLIAWFKRHRPQAD
jgi:hypothetical protein